MHLHLSVQTDTLLARDRFKTVRDFHKAKMDEECESISFVVPVTRITAAPEWLEVLGTENIDLNTASDHIN